MRLHPKGRQLMGDLMTLRGYSHRQVARAAGWKSHSFLTRLLNGQRSCVSTESATLLAEFFGLPVHYLFLPESTRQDVPIDAPVKSKQVA